MPPSLALDDYLKGASGGATFFNIAAITGGTQIKTGSGSLYAVIIGTPVANAVATFYDNVGSAANKITAVTLPAAIGQPAFLPFGILFNNGLWIVTTTVADITVAYV